MQNTDFYSRLFFRRDYAEGGSLEPGPLSFLRSLKKSSGFMFLSSSLKDFTSSSEMGLRSSGHFLNTVSETNIGQRLRTASAKASLGRASMTITFASALR